jgi:hypothetical protein
MLDYGSDFLWADDQETEDLYGYQVDLVRLGIPEATLALHEFVSYLYHMRLNPIYQNFPSFWSGETHLFFQEKVIQPYNDIKAAVRDGLEIAVAESTAIEMNEQIDVVLINNTLKDFVLNPAD